jgi:cytochrome c
LTQVNQSSDPAEENWEQAQNRAVPLWPNLVNLKGTAMKFPISPALLTSAALGAAVLSLSTGATAAVDAAAAQALARKSDCLKCHAVDKTKKAPSYQKIAAKYKGKADAEAKLVDFVQKGAKVKLEDGTEEEHKVVQTKDAGEIKNIVGWILAQ